jgi:uncharacterized protein
MLRVDLGQLGREGSVAVEASISADDDLWKDTKLQWAGDVDVRLRATFAGTGEVVARGRARGTLRQECRRCLKPVDTDIEHEMTLVFVEDGSEEHEDDGGSTYVFEASGVELDLSGAVREEVILAMNPYVVCDPECRGLCPQCGKNLNEGSCDCTQDETDPRWAALRELKSE